jgi:hypothetical protein
MNIVKRMNFKRKLISYIVIWSVVFGSLLSYSPENRVLSATGVPEITLISPLGGSVFEVSKVEFTGKILDDLTTPDKLVVKVFEQSDVSEQPIDITNEGQLIITHMEQYLEFSFTKDFSEGEHKISFIATDGDGFSSSLETSFTVELSGNMIDVPVSMDNSSNATAQASSIEGTDSKTTVKTAVVSASATTENGIRPYMAKMYLIPPGSEGEYRPDNAPQSYLPAEDMTRVPLDYKILIDIRSADAFNPSQPLVSFFVDSKGTEKLVNTIELSGGITSYIYTFTPENPKLDAATTYSVYLNPNILIPRFLKFTTVSDNYESYQFPADKGNDVRDNDYIHGPFSMVSNACAFCHSTHNGNTLTLESRNTGSESDNLCMACHDGTYGSPKLEDTYNSNKHNQNSSASCTSCHNPHTPGTKENPNSFHASEAEDADINPFLTYKKASTAIGDVTDSTLCFSCHNGITKDDKGNIISNIEQYYKNETYTGQSGHNITASVDSGSMLDGQLPCAECHETHGSSNIKMLRSNLGNVKLEDPKLLFKSSSAEWVAEERSFCLSCHKNSTEIYGNKSTFNLVSDTTGDPIQGHQEDDNVKNTPCSSCHGGSDPEKATVEAAHAPKKATHLQAPINP